MKALTLLTISLLSVGGPWLTHAQVANEGQANAIIAARQKNAQLMQQFS